MTRVRTDNVFGTITDNPLLVGATTMNSAGLANLAAVSSAEAFITLDPNRVAGAPEIVVVTAHTGSATSATIQRGQFGTTARQHASGTQWVHGPIASNATSYATLADDQGDFVPMNEWGTWTPTYTGFTLGNGTVVARFIRAGRSIHFRIRVILGTTSSVSGAIRFSLPVEADNTYDSFFTDVLGHGVILDTGAAIFACVALAATTSTAELEAFDAGSTYLKTAGVSSTVPMTWTTGDGFSVEGTYEAAT